MYELIHLVGSISLITCFVSWLLIITKTFYDMRKVLVVALIGSSSTIVLFVCVHIVVLPRLMEVLINL